MRCFVVLPAQQILHMQILFRRDRTNDREHQSTLLLLLLMMMMMMCDHTSLEFCEGDWNLEFGIWNLEFGIWNLEFQIICILAVVFLPSSKPY